MNTLKMIAIGIAMSACAPIVWQKQGATQEQFQRDFADCKLYGAQYASAMYGPDGALFFGKEYAMECLRARGYQPAKKP